MKKALEKKGAAVSKALVITSLVFAAVVLAVIFRGQIGEFFGWIYSSILSIFGLTPGEFADGASEIFSPQIIT